MEIKNDVILPAETTVPVFLQADPGGMPNRPSHMRRIVLIIVLAVVGSVGYLWWRAGFTFDISRFFAAEVGTMTIQCSPSGNVITWTYDDRYNSNSIQRGNAGAKNLSDCADYWCWLPTISYLHQQPTSGNPATYTDTQLQSGTCYEYRIKYRPELPSNTMFCPTNCNIVATTPLPTIDLKCDAVDGPCSVQTGDRTALSWTVTDATSCAASGGWSGAKSAAGGSEVSGALSANTAFTLTCTGPDGTASDTVQVNVVQAAIVGQLVCGPATQVVDSGATLSITASGGTPAYGWAADGGFPSSGQGATFQTSFVHTGLPVQENFSISVMDANERRAVCSVVVRCQSPTCSSPPQGCSYQNANVCECGTLVCATTTPAALSCSPSSQTVATGQSVSFSAVGGSGVYSWSAPSGTPGMTTSGAQFSASYASPGGYTVVVGDGQSVAQCVVSVVAVVPTPTPVSGQPALTVAKTVRNISRGTQESESVPASGGETVEFVVRVTSAGTDVARNVIVRDALPSGLTFIPGSVTVDGVVRSTDIPSAGIIIGDLVVSRTAIVRFRASVPAGAGVPGSTTDTVNVASAYLNGVQLAHADGATVTIVGPSGTIAPVAQVQTGPGQASVLALIISAIATLMYVGYTSTGAFRRREAAGYSRDRHHPDFR